MKPPFKKKNASLEAHSKERKKTLSCLIAFSTSGHNSGRTAVNIYYGVVLVFVVINLMVSEDKCDLEVNGPK